MTNDQLKTLIAANWSIVICAGFYLAWWLITFRPPEPRGSIVGRICLVIAAISGLAGFAIAAKILSDLDDIGAVGSGLSGWVILAGGVISYFVLLAISAVAFRRQVTSELLIIVGWGTLELSIINALYRGGRMPQLIVLTLSSVMIIAIIADLICYMLYYDVPYEKGYVIGCIPLVLAMIITSLICISG